MISNEWSVRKLGVTLASGGILGAFGAPPISAAGRLWAVIGASSAGMANGIAGAYDVMERVRTGTVSVGELILVEESGTQARWGGIIYGQESGGGDENRSPSYFGGPSSYTIALSGA